MPGPSVPLDALRDHRTVLLTSFRRDGTPDHIAFDGPEAYVRTCDRLGELKRIRRNSGIMLPPSTVRGVPTGPAISSTAYILAGEEAKRAARTLARKYPIAHGILIPWCHRIRDYTTIHFRIESHQGWR